MAYNALLQYELDAPFEADYPRSSSSVSEHHRPHESSSPDADSRSRSRRLDDAMEGVRTVSREGSVLRHPTPDLQSLQGAYVGNVERLEQSAARLSLSSNIGEELHRLKMEQRRSDSRHSSVLNSPSEVEEHAPSMSRQPSQGYGSHASNSIVGTNNVARSGGFSPAAYFASPRNSVRSAGTWSHQSSIKERSASYGTRLTLLSEPEQEGKPLDSPLSTRLIPVIPKPDPLANGLRIVNNGQFNLDDVAIPHTEPEEKEAAEQAGNSRVSTDTFRQVNGLFTDFDGVHAGDQTQGQQDFADFDGEHTAYQSQHPEDIPDNMHPNQRVSTYPPPASRPTSYMEPTPTDNMTYYPAPVPMMLNLPKRLSKLPAAPRRDKRRSELLGSLPKEARQSAPWLPDVLESADGRSSRDEDHRSMPGRDTKRRTVADLPPQLRASMFFDQPAVRQEVKVQGESAVATLDSILDASAFAPVSAFTDHPIAGHVGAEVYATAPVKPKSNVTPAEADPSRKRRSSVNLLTKRNSSSNLIEQSRKRSSTTVLTKRESSSKLPEDTKKRNSLMSLGNVFGRRNSSTQALDTAEDYHEVEAAEKHGEETPLQEEDGEYGPTNFNDAEEETEDPEKEQFEQEQANGWIGQPTTLLAELQMRKQQQKQRNRTAATAFPNGMQSTLLQLDAVAHVQKQARKQKRTHLAWEDPEMNHAGANDEDDEDVPLGMLFPKRQMDVIERSHRFDEDRPLGLIAKREIEDNEPLSHRRARLRGEDPLADAERRNTMYTLDPFDFQDQPQPQPLQNGDQEGEDETLGQRIRRLKATQIPVQPRPVSGDFASEMMSQLGVPSDPPKAHPPPSKTPDGLEEETLAQRRKRLQAEANRPREANGDSNPRPPLTIRRSMADILQAHPAAGAGPATAVRTFSNEIKFAPAPKTRNTAWAINQTRQASTGQLPMASGIASGWGAADGAAMGGGEGYAPHPMVVQQGIGIGMGISMNASAEGELRQRDMIDRWRQSVMYS